MLSEEEGLVLRAVEAFKDTDGVRRAAQGPGPFQDTRCYYGNGTGFNAAARVGGNELQVTQVTKNDFFIFIFKLLF